MRHLLNTLYVTTQGSYVARDGETVAVRFEEETRLRVPVHTLEGLVCFGQVGCSPFAMQLCTENNVAVSFLTENGRFLARVQGPVHGNVLLRRTQYRQADNPAFAAEVARSMVMAKVANSRVVLLRAARESANTAVIEALQAAAQKLSRCLASLLPGKPLDWVRGLEGDAARHYFSVFDALITGDKQAFFFQERSRRPPLDNVNALLSFLYTLLTHDVRGALETAGLDPAVGFLHTDRPGRPSLALDLMEEFRAILADRLALSLINRRQVAGSGFRRTAAGGIEMEEATRKEVLIAWQKRKQEEVQHPYLQEKMKLGLLPHVQALLLARHIRGGLDAYPSYFHR